MDFVVLTSTNYSELECTAVYNPVFSQTILNWNVLQYTILCLQYILSVYNYHTNI